LSLALLGSIVDEKKIFCFFSGTWRYWDSRIPDFRVLTFPLDFLVLKKLALFERIFYNQRNTISLYSSKGGTQLSLKAIKNDEAHDGAIPSSVVQGHTVTLLLMPRKLGSGPFQQRTRRGWHS